MIDPHAVRLEDLLEQSQWVRGLARRLVADPHLAGDVEQQAWLSALQRPPRDARNLRAWFGRLVRRRLRDQLRSEGRRRHHHQQAGRPEGVPSTDALVVRVETRTTVAQTVLALDEPYRTMVLLRYFEGLPPRDIAEHLNIPVATVNTRLQRALSKLRGILEERYGAKGESWRAALAPIAGLGEIGSGLSVGTATSAAAGSTAKAPVLLLVGALVVVLAVGTWFVVGGRSESVEGSSDPSALPSSPVRDVGGDASIAAAQLRGRAEADQAELPSSPSEAAVPESSSSVLALEGPFAIQGSVARNGRPARARIELYAAAMYLQQWAELLRTPEAEEHPLVTCHTDQEGRFEIRGLPPGGYNLVARGDDGGYGAQRAHVGPPIGSHARPEIELTGGPEILVGRASWADGRPFSGWARVWSGPWFDQGGWSPAVKTDSQGRFRIVGVQPGTSGVGFLVPGELSSIFWGVEVPAASGREFVLDEGLAEVRGRVVADDTNLPLSGVAIEVRSGGRTGRRGAKPLSREVIAATQSDQDGNFTLMVDGRKAEFGFHVDGFAPTHESLEPGTEHVVRLKPRGRVIGHVVARGDERRVPGVDVHAWNWPASGAKSPLATSDDQGRFEGLVGPGQGHIIAFGGGWVSVDLTRLTSYSVMPAKIEAGPAATAEIEVEVIEAGRVEGVVRRANGSPVAGVAVRLDQPQRWRGFKPGFWHPLSASTSTDRDGVFAFSDLIPGFPYLVTATPLSSPQGRSEPFTAESGTAHRVEIVLPETRWLAVRVLAKDGGAPLEGAVVGGRQEGRYFPAKVSTRPDGRARFGPLGAGPVWIHVQRDGYLRAPMLERGFGGSTGMAIPDPWPAEVVVELKVAHRVTGSVRKPDGTPFTGGGVQLERTGATEPSGFGLRGRAILKEDGTFAFAPVPAGRYDLVLISAKRTIARWTVETGRGPYDVTLEASQLRPPEDPMRVRLVGPDGREARGFLIVYRQDGYLSTSPVKFEELTPGEVVRIEVRSPRDADDKPLGGTLSGPLPVREGMVVIQLPPEKVIEGRILGPDREPIRGLRVSALPLHPGVPAGRANGIGPTSRTNEAGEFRLGRLADVPYRILLELPEEYAAITPPEIVAGSTGVEIGLETGTSVRVRIEEANGNSAKGARLRVALPNHPWLVRLASTDKRGEAVLNGLDSETVYSLLVEPPPGRGDLAVLRLERWRAVSETLVLRPRK